MRHYFCFMAALLVGMACADSVDFNYIRVEVLCDAAVGLMPNSKTSSGQNYETVQCALVSSTLYRCSVEALSFAQDSVRIRPRIKHTTGEPVMGVSVIGLQGQTILVRAEDGDGSEIAPGGSFTSGDTQTSCFLISVKKALVGG